ncbi:MAG: Ig domain-containing protein [Candidatus Sulfotelmatobacter sp.]
MRERMIQMGLCAALVFTMLLHGCSGVSQGPSNQTPPPPSPALTITTTSFPNGTVGAAYSVALQASGGTSPYTWSVASGNLPTGVAVNASSGVVSGTPSQSGSSDFTIQVADSSLHTATQTLSLSIGPALAMTTTALAAGSINHPYTAVLKAVGGTSPFAWSISQGQLPSGLSLNGTTGQISGTPSQGGTFTVTTTLRDANSYTLSKSFSLLIFEQPLDQYGGLINNPSPNGGTGYFRLEKNGSRWLFVDPLGSYFWMMMNEVVTDYDGGATYDTALCAKYGGCSGNNLGLSTWQNFCTQSDRRLLSWGFNTLGSGTTAYCMPIGTYGDTHVSYITDANAYMPYVMYIKPALYGLTNASNPVKDIIYGTLSTRYTGWRGKFVDVYDPNFATEASEQMSSLNSIVSYPTGGLDASPYLLAVGMDDFDNLFGWRNATNSPHIGWITAITAPTQTSNSVEGMTYADTTVHAKVAWQTYVQDKYVTVAAMNTAWGSTYTTFGSSGGWPKSTTSGTGLMDEDGSSSWFGTDTSGETLTGINDNLLSDLNTFLAQLTDQYFSVMSFAIRAVVPHHLIAGPLGASPLARSQLWTEAGKYVDYMDAAVDPYDDPIGVSQGLNTVYTSFQKPILSGTGGISAQADSPFAGTAPLEAAQNWSTQAERGTEYTNESLTSFNTQATDGTFFVIGYDFFEWADFQPTVSKQNYGLVTDKDNAYDGMEATSQSGTDSWGFAVGSELGNYSDFIGAVQGTNFNALRSIAQ